MAKLTGAEYAKARTVAAREVRAKLAVARRAVARRNGFWGIPKQSGECVELEFMVRSVKERFVVTKPWGETVRWDVGVQYRRRSHQRVQVKHSMGPRRGTNTFRIAVTTSAGPYTVKDADWLAIYLVSIDTWYLIPVRKLRRRNGTLVWHVQITPGGRQPGQWDQYRERWDLLRDAGKRKRRKKK